MRLTEESSIIFAEVLKNRQMVEGFISANYPQGELGMMLFKADCQRWGMTKQLNIIEQIEKKKTRYVITILGDAKGKNHKFGLTSVNGDPFYCGCFLEPKSSIINQADCQNWCEVHAFVYALRLARMFALYKGIKPEELTLHYLTDSQVVESCVKAKDSMSFYSHIIRKTARETKINLKVDWIRGVDNHADLYTLPEGEIVHPDFEKMNKFLIDLN